MTHVVGIRFKNSAKIYDFDANDLPLEEGAGVIVNTDLGLSYGTVAAPLRPLTEKDNPARLKKIQRMATDDDRERIKQHAVDETLAQEYCAEWCKKFKLTMNLFAVEKAFDGSKYTFFFTSEGRVDFRQLVKVLVKRFDAKIEMRQVGIRNQAKMCGGLGRCGRELCCSSFIEKFEPVSIKMAKEQGLSLNPTKISGQCGRLMCCLTYEYETYCAMKKDFPKMGKNIDTPQGRGKVIRHNSLFGTVAVRLEENDQEIEFNVPQLISYKESLQEQQQEAQKSPPRAGSADEGIDAAESVVDPQREHDFPLAEVLVAKPGTDDAESEVDIDDDDVNAFDDSGHKEDFVNVETGDDEDLQSALLGLF